MGNITSFITACVLLSFVFVAKADSPPTLILIDGNVITMSKPAQAQAVAITGHTISAVGSNSDVLAQGGPSTQVIPLNGATVIPGLIEGHGHFLSLGNAQMIPAH